MIEELGNSPNETNWTFVKTTDNVNLSYKLFTESKTGKHLCQSLFF